MTTAHSRLAPSSADRWVFCPASVRTAEAFPQLVEDPSAVEGTASHWAGYAMLKTHTPQPGDICPENGVLLTEEMLEGALTYYNAVFAIANTVGGIAAMHLEERVAISRLHPQMFGTPDAWVWDAANGLLHVIDYKYGHRGVDPFENWQLAVYACGILESLGFDGAAEQHIKVRFTIVQPRSFDRAGPVKTWETLAANLRGMWNRAHGSAHEALESDNPTFAIGSHCRDCPARRACPTLARNSQSVMDYSNQAMPRELTPAELSIELMYHDRAEELVIARGKALRQQAEVSIRNGQAVPGFGLDSGRGSVKWTADVADVQGLGEMCGVDLLKPAALVTPAQAKNLFAKKGLDASVIAAYSTHIPGAQQLVPIEETIAHRVFAKGNM